MAFDFPSSPTTGQTYSVTGGPTYVYNGTAWVVLTPGNQFNRTVFTATAGQTTFTMNYVVGAIDVYRNGVKLAPADFTATNGTSIVLANGCTVGDTVEVISYPMITYSDAVKRTGDTMTGDLTVPNIVGTGSARFGSGSSTGGVIRATSTGRYADLICVTSNVNSAFYSDDTSLIGAVGTVSSHPFVITTGNTERVRIDTTGRVTTPYQPAFTAYKDNVGAYGTVGTVVFNNVLLNRGNHYNSTTGKFTAPVAGVYSFGFFAHTETVNASARLANFRRNGVAGFCEVYVLPNNSREQVGKQFYIQMAAGDTMEFHNDTGDWWAGGSSGMMFTGQLIG